MSTPWSSSSLIVLSICEFILSHLFVVVEKSLISEIFEFLHETVFEVLDFVTLEEHRTLELLDCFDHCKHCVARKMSEELT